MRVLRFSIVTFLTIGLSMSCSPDVDVIEEQLTLVQEVDSPSRLTAKALYFDYYESTRSDGNESPWSGNEPNCQAGEVPSDIKSKILNRLFYFRLAVGLTNEIAVSSSKSEKAQQAALMMHANNTLDHFPPDTWKCYSVAGKEGAGNSLLTTAVKAEAIDSYIRDAGSANGPVGHRRWLLWPELQEIGVGNTDGANAIWVLNGGGASLANTPEFIAWPPKGYAPKQLIYPRWSFSLKDADFTNAKVSMLDASRNSMTVEVEELSNQFGDRTIVWVPSGMPTNISEDTTYTITISSVIVNGETKDFTYDVTIFDPEK